MYRAVRRNSSSLSPIERFTNALVAGHYELAIQYWMNENDENKAKMWMHVTEEKIARKHAHALKSYKVFTDDLRDLFIDSKRSVIAKKIAFKKN